MSTQIIANGSKSFFSNLKGKKGVCTLEHCDDANLFMGLAGADYGISRIPAPHPMKTGTFVENQHFLVRSSDGAVVSPKTVSRSYGPISPTDLFDSVREHVDSGILVLSDFILQERKGIVGQVETLVFRFADSVRDDVNGESDHGWYLLLSNNHGGGKVTGSVAMFRPWCSNQITRILKGFDWAISHGIAVGDETAVQRKMQQKVNQWDRVQSGIRTAQLRLNLFSGYSLSLADAEEFLNKTMGIKENEKTSTQKKNLRSNILAEFDNAERGTFGKTLFDLYMGVTAVNSHHGKAPNADRATKVLSGALGSWEENFAAHALELVRN